MPKKLFIFIVIFVNYFALSPYAKEGDELIGTHPSEWQLKPWFNSEPLQLQQLKGKVVLVRWWTGPQCPYCARSAPALNEFHEKYQSQGLVVIGIYHHKSPLPLTKKHVPHLIQKYRFQFPVAVDPEWKNLQRWWMKEKERSWTSISFLLDKDGVIRYIHPGGQYVKGDADYQQLKAWIEKLISE